MLTHGNLESVGKMDRHITSSELQGKSSLFFLSLMCVHVAIPQGNSCSCREQGRHHTATSVVQHTCWKWLVHRLVLKHFFSIHGRKFRHKTVVSAISSSIAESELLLCAFSAHVSVQTKSSIWLRHNSNVGLLGFLFFPSTPYFSSSPSPSWCSRASVQVCVSLSSSNLLSGITICTSHARVKREIRKVPFRTITPSFRLSSPALPHIRTTSNTQTPPHPPYSPPSSINTSAVLQPRKVI